MKRAARNLALAIACLVVPVTSAVVAAAPPMIKVKMAYVDTERCVNETEDGLRAKAALIKLKVKRESQLMAMEDRLKAAQEDLAALSKSAKGPSPQLSAAVFAYDKDLRAYQDQVKAVNLELARREDELFYPIEKKVKAIYKRIAEAEGIDLVVDKKTVPVPGLKPEYDLTERVLREYNWGPPGGASASASASGK